MSGAAEMTAADLERHRITELEKDATAQAERLRLVERDVDILKVEQAGLIGAVARLEGKLDERDKNLTTSLARLHERLDERLREVAPVADVAALKAEFTKAREVELREEGAKAMRAQLRRFWFAVTGATVSVIGMVIAGLALVLH